MILGAACSHATRRRKSGYNLSGRLCHMSSINISLPEPVELF